MAHFYKLKIKTIDWQTTFNQTKAREKKIKQ